MANMPTFDCTRFKMAQAKPTLTTDPGPQYSQCKDEAVKLLDKAAIEWSKGDPTDPSAEEVLKSVLAVFIKERFLRPPNGAG
jgi:hypothetical protein